MRKHAVVLTFLLVASGCGGSSDTATPATTVAPATTQAPTTIDQVTTTVASTTTAAPTPTTVAPTTTVLAGLVIDCTLDAEGLKMSCRSTGYQDGSQLTWTSSGSWAHGAGSQWDFTIHDELLTPTTEVALEECQGSNCQIVEISIDTSALVPEEGGDTPMTADSPTSEGTSAGVELTVDCSFDEPARLLSCEASGYDDIDSLRWTSSLRDGESYGGAYEYQLGWGVFVEEIFVQLSDCDESDCDVASTTLAVALQPRGDCPDDFTGWFTTFPLEDPSLLVEVGPPARFTSEGFRKGHGYFDLPFGQNEVNLRLPVDATLYHGHNYMQRGETGLFDLQYRLEFRTKCEGLLFRFDHIAEPVAEIAALFTREPSTQGSTASVQSGGDYELSPLEMDEGDLVATSVGFLQWGWAKFDHGIYDNFHRVPTAQHEQFLNATCFFDFYSPAIAELLRSRSPERDQVEESLSWCRTASIPPTNG